MLPEMIDCKQEIRSSSQIRTKFVYIVFHRKRICMNEKMMDCKILETLES